MTVGLVDRAPQDHCKVSITPRRLQAFKPDRGQKLHWSNTPAGSDKAIQSGEVTADDNGLATLPQVIVSKEKNRITVRKQ
jgi:hypothetical protein